MNEVKKEGLRVDRVRPPLVILSRTNFLIVLIADHRFIPVPLSSVVQLIGFIRITKDLVINTFFVSSMH